MDGGLRAWKRVMTPGSISAILPFAETSLSRTAANTLMTAAPSASSVGVDSMKKERRGGRGGGKGGRFLEVEGGLKSILGEKSDDELETNGLTSRGPPPFHPHPNVLTLWLPADSTSPPQNLTFKGLWMDIKGFFGESLDRSISGVSQMSKGVLLCSQLFSQFSRP